MAKRVSKAKKPKSRKRRAKTLAELNASLSANYEQLLAFAQRNCLRLTGKPTFGAGKRRKSA